MELLPQLIWEGEGLSVLATRDGNAIVRAAGDAVLVPERVVEVAFAILGIWSPECLAAIERGARASRLRLVRGGEPGGSAA